MDDLKDLLTVHEAAARRNVHPQEYYVAIWSGRLRAFRKGKFYLLRLSDVEEFERSIRRYVRSGRYARPAKEEVAS